MPHELNFQHIMTHNSQDEILETHDKLRIKSRNRWFYLEGKDDKGIFFFGEKKQLYHNLPLLTK